MKGPSTGEAPRRRRRDGQEEDKDQRPADRGDRQCPGEASADQRGDPWRSGVPSRGDGETRGKHGRAEGEDEAHG